MLSVMPMAAGREWVVGPDKWRNREAPMLNGSSKWMLKPPKIVTALGWRASQKARVLVKCAMNEGCDPGGQWVLCNKDSGDMAFKGAGAFEGEGG